MIIIGICGRSGSGKSTVGKLIESKGYAYIDCDKTARDVTEKGSPCLVELTKFFGEKILNSDGSLNRGNLASVAFGNEKKLKQLNKITHKYILEEIKKEIDRFAQHGSKIVFLDAPTLFESKLYKRCDKILSVVADDSFLLERIEKRDNKSKSEAKKRLSSQLDNKFLIQNSHFVIENNGSLEQLYEKTELFLKEIEGIYE